MPCYSPIRGYKADGKFTIVNPKNNNNRYDLLSVSCGQCIGCRIQRSLDWGVRCANEIQMHDRASFLTLTYSDEYLPVIGNRSTLVKAHLQKFLKRLRRTLEYNSNRKVRYYACGEYGDETGRAHYHVLLFGEDFADDRYYWKSYKGNKYFRSPLLEKLWPFGNSMIGEANFTTACYISRYITKKRLGKDASKYYLTDVIDKDTGEVLSVEPEYTTMSLKPGIGATWFKQFKSDVFPSDEVIVNGKSFRVPPYYFSLLEKDYPQEAKEISAKRQQYIRNKKADEDMIEDYKRNVAKERCAISRLSNELLKEVI